MVTKQLGRERSMNLARLSLCFEEQFGTIHGSNQKLGHALSDEIHDVLDSLKDGFASGELRNR
jgi:hypothetical protein